MTFKCSVILRSSGDRLHSVTYCLEKSESVFLNDDYSSWAQTKLSLNFLGAVIDTSNFLFFFFFSSFSPKHNESLAKHFLYLTSSTWLSSHSVAFFMSFRTEDSLCVCTHVSHFPLYFQKSRMVNDQKWYRFRIFFQHGSHAVGFIVGESRKDLAFKEWKQ